MTMSEPASYLGMNLGVSDLDVENKEYFRYCAERRFHLQACDACKLLRYPPTTACPWCSNAESHWMPVNARGTVHSYTEVHHAIQPAFKAHTPYLILLVDLDTQKGVPSEHEALRVVGNYTDAEGRLAGPDAVKKIGIGSHVRMVFSGAGPSMAVPQWTLDETAAQPAQPWRYPEYAIPPKKT
jgi:uncharacterized OB-fold protein